jgi:hypothetical protein
VTVQIAAGAGVPLEVESAALASAEGWAVSAPAAGKTVEPGAIAEWKLSATLPANAEATVPYFLRHPLAGAMYDWTGVPPEIRGEPYAPPPLSAVIALRIGGARILFPDAPKSRRRPAGRPSRDRFRSRRRVIARRSSCLCGRLRAERLPRGSRFPSRRFSTPESATRAECESWTTSTFDRRRGPGRPPSS